MGQQSEMIKCGEKLGKVSLGNTTQKTIAGKLFKLD